MPEVTGRHGTEGGNGQPTGARRGAAGEKVPDALRPFIFHGLDYSLTPDGAQARMDCPLCGKEGKFYVGLLDKGKHFSGGWDCKSCGERGNVTTFLRRLWDEAEQQTKYHEQLARDRRLLHAQTLDEWGVRKSPVSGEWLVPGYSTSGKLIQLYRYVSIKEGDKWTKRLLPTPGPSSDEEEGKHGLHGVQLYDKRKPRVFLCEGAWDGPALWEVLQYAKEGDDGLALTSSPTSSLAASCNVLAVPGCNVFKPSWVDLFSDKDVTILYDSDHARLRCKLCKKTYSLVTHKTCDVCGGKLVGPEISPPGFEGTRRVVEALSGAKKRPARIRWLSWGEKGYDPKLPSGYDVRDWLSDGGETNIDVGWRVKLLETLLARCADVPKQWTESRTASVQTQQVEQSIMECTSWADLEEGWRKAFRWSYGLRAALLVMLACCLSTEVVGDQLWVMVRGPAASGKTTLCEALSTARRWVYPKDTLTGLVSGYMVDRDGSEDLSLAQRLRNMTLVVNDGDTLLKAPNLAQILSQLRAFYGRTIRTQYGNKMSKDHEGINTTILLCGTGALCELDASELGARFIDVEIMRNVDRKMERSIGIRKVEQVRREIGIRANGRVEDSDNKELADAKRLTGGYVDHLRRTAFDLLPNVRMSDEITRRCVVFGEFTAHLRARPPKKQDERTEREMSARLVSQFAKLAFCLTAVMNKEEVDEEVMMIVRKVALDTSHGRTLEVVRHLRTVGEAGLPLKKLGLLVVDTDEKLRYLLRFLRRIGVTEIHRPEIGRGVRAADRWRLTEYVTGLYDEVMGTDDGEMDEGGQ